MNHKDDEATKEMFTAEMHSFVPAATRIRLIASSRYVNGWANITRN